LKTETVFAKAHSSELLSRNVNIGMARVCVAVSAGSIAIGLLVLIGWLFMIEALKRIAPGFVAMNPLSAILLITAGSALFLARSRDARAWPSRRVAQILAFSVAAIGFLKLLFLWRGVDWALDSWFFSNELLSAGTNLPNRMAPNTAFNFLLSGMALFLIDFEIRGHRPSELLSVLCGVSGILALAGYIYQAPMLYGIGYAIPMALHTALGFILLALGILVARPHVGIMAIVASDTAGGMVARKLLPLSVVLPIALGLLRLYGEHTGLYDAEFGTAIYSTALVLLFLIIVWWMARILFELDTERKYIERWQSEKLERTVQERTRRLQHALGQLRETQQQVLQQERLHALGTMASGVTHDFNNALSVIIGFGEMALNECEKQSDAGKLEQYLSSILIAALDGAKVVTRLREFYRVGGHEEPRARVDLNALIEQAISITQPRWKSQSQGGGVKIGIKTELGDVSPAAGDAAELREALANLIFNAVDAMPGGGTITLRTRAEEDRVVVEICDSGIGMSKEVQRKCLDPFFTTKGEHGTGLGLAMVYGIVERHRGTLKIDTEVGHGTTFVISLPKHTSSEEIAENSAPPVTSPLRILIADDQPLLCEILAEYLKNDCHSVICANDGREALEKFVDGAVDVVITDQAMPEMSGNQLACAIKARSPATPVILLTGFGEANGDGAQAIDHVLSKPVSLIDLRHALLRVTNPSSTVTVGADSRSNSPGHPRLPECARVG
jgi:signal transduction histidine kinase/ActR/RegA family two-component response regulator